MYKLNPPGFATSVILRKISGYDTDNVSHYQPIALAQMRVYQSTNLLSYGATIHYATPSIAGNEATNLLNNLESRSSVDQYNARLSATSWDSTDKATYKSCYAANYTNIAADDGKMKLVIDLAVKHYIHAILMVQELGELYAWGQVGPHREKWYL